METLYGNVHFAKVIMSYGECCGSKLLREKELLALNAKEAILSYV